MGAIWKRKEHSLGFYFPFFSGLRLQRRSLILKVRKSFTLLLLFGFIKRIYCYADFSFSILRKDRSLRENATEWRNSIRNQ